jgi:uncharacterized peroxidase-related enzyme
MSTYPDYITALDLPLQDKAELDEDIQEAYEFLEENHGLIPNILKAYSFDQDKMRPFMALYNSIMVAESELTMLEREMIGVVVSSINNCLYCQVAHGAGIRGMSGDPKLGEMIVMNYRVAKLEPRQRAMLDFAARVTEKSYEISEDDREALRQHGFSDRAIWDIASVAALFNFTNRMSSALDIIPNAEYHYMFRTEPE